MALTVIHAGILAVLVFAGCCISYQRGENTSYTKARDLKAQEITTHERIEVALKAQIDALERNVDAKDKTIVILKQLAHYNEPQTR